MCDEAIIVADSVTLRPPVPADFDRFAEIWAEPEVTRYIGGTPRGHSKSWQAFLTGLGHWQMQGFGNWMIVDRSADKIIGQVGFFQAFRGLGDDFDTAAECGWVLAPQSQGRGLGHLCVGLAHHWWDENHPDKTTVCVLSAENVASVAVARRAGYKALRQVDFDGEPAELMQRRRG